MNTDEKGIPQAEAARGPSVDNSPSNQPNQTHDESVDWRKKAKAFEKELFVFRPMVLENRRLRRCIDGVGVLGRALKESKQEVTHLRRLLEHGAPSCITLDTRTESKGGSKGTSALDVTVSLNYDIKGNTKGNTDADKDGDMLQLEQLIEKSPESPGVGHIEHLSTLVIEPLGGGEQLESKIEGNQLSQNDFKNDRTEIQGNESETEAAFQKRYCDSSRSERDIVNKIDNQDAYCDLEALIIDHSSKIAPTQPSKTPTHASDVRSVATFTEDEDSFFNSALNQQEYSSLKMQVQELKKINNEWEIHCRKEKSAFIDHLSDKDRTIGKLQSQLADAAAELNTKAKHYEQTLLTAKTRIEKIEKENQLLKMDVDHERQKSEKSEMLNRTLVKQNLNMEDEIVRHKKALERQYQQHIPASQSPSPGPAALSSAYSRSSAAKIGNAESQSCQESGQPKHRYNTTERTAAISAPMPLMASTDEETQAQDLLPSVWKKTNEKTPTAADKSLSKHEIKEQVELFRQQNKMFESDFKKERADRQKANDELQVLRHELNKRGDRTQVHGRHRQVMDRDYDMMKGDKVRSKVQGPPKQGAYNPPGPTSSAQRVHSKPQTKPVRRTDKDLNVVKCGQDTICKIVNPRTIIIHTDTEGRGVNINFQSEMERVGKKSPVLHDPFQCPRCQKLFPGSDWESYEHHVTLCNI